MYVLIWIAFVVIVLLMLLVGGRAERFNLRFFMRPVPAEVPTRP
jgi:hypothetical protein